LPAGDGIKAQQDHHQQARQLDQRQHHVCLHAFGRAAQVHQHHQQHEAQRAERDPRLLGLDAERGEQVRGERLGRRGRRCQPRTHDGEADDEGQKVHAERLVHIQRRAGRLGVLGDQFQVGQRGQQRDGKGHQEGQPGRAANFGGDLAGQCINACAQDVANNEQQQQLGAHHALERRVFRLRWGFYIGCSHLLFLLFL